MKFFLSFFGVGFIKYAPGTFGSIATLPLMYYLSLLNLSTLSFIAIIIVLIISSTFITEHIQKKEGLHDPGWIVIDEVIGMLVTWLVFYPVFNLKTSLLVLICFRFFDIIKFWPATYFDKKVNHGFGTIIDDVFAAFYAIFVIIVIKNFL